MVSSKAASLVTWVNIASADPFPTLDSSLSLLLPVVEYPLQLKRPNAPVNIASHAAKHPQQPVSSPHRCPLSSSVDRMLLHVLQTHHFPQHLLSVHSDTALNKTEVCAATGQVQSM